MTIGEGIAIAVAALSVAWVVVTLIKHISEYNRLFVEREKIYLERMKSRS